MEAEPEAIVPQVTLASCSAKQENATEKAPEVLEALPESGLTDLGIVMNKRLARQMLNQ